MASVTLLLNVFLLERPLPRPLPRELAGYEAIWVPEKQQYFFIVVETS